MKKLTLNGSKAYVKAKGNLNQCELLKILS
jgi:hypothetical protein